LLLQANELTKTFRGPSGTVAAVDGVSLALEAGQFVTISGESGCGKTTLLLMIGGLLRPDRGEVHLEGENPYELPPGPRARFRNRQIGFVFQQFHLVPYLTVLENIMAPALAGNAAGARNRAWELVRRFRLEDRAGHCPAMLSTGQRQRTAMARAVQQCPKLLLADEPTGNLDHENAEIVLSYFAEFAGAGGTVLVMTHDERSAAYADRRYGMAGGRLEAALT
jgi:putative ABC transport system ATP-binding protein